MRETIITIEDNDRGIRAELLVTYSLNGDDTPECVNVKQIIEGTLMFDDYPAEFDGGKYDGQIRGYIAGFYEEEIIEQIQAERARLIEAN